MMQAQAKGRRFERFLLGTGMSVMLLVLERRVIKMQRAGARHDAGHTHRS